MASMNDSRVYDRSAGCDWDAKRHTSVGYECDETKSTGVLAACVAAMNSDIQPRPAVAGPPTCSRTCAALMAAAVLAYNSK